MGCQATNLPKLTSASLATLGHDPSEFYEGGLKIEFAGEGGADEH